MTKVRFGFRERLTAFLTLSITIVTNVYAVEVPARTPKPISAQDFRLLSYSHQVGKVSVPCESTPRRDAGCNTPAIFIPQDADTAFDTFPVAITYYPEGSIAFGVYILRVEMGPLVKSEKGVFAQDPNYSRPLKLRAGDAVSWDVLFRGMENHQKPLVPFTETVQAPIGTVIFRCDEAQRLVGACDSPGHKEKRFYVCKEALSKQERSRCENNGQAKVTDRKPNFELVMRRSIPSLGPGEHRAVSNIWEISDADPAGNYFIELRLAGKLLAKIEFEVVK